MACIGENSYCKTPGNLSDLAISRNQAELVAFVNAEGKWTLEAGEFKMQMGNQVVKVNCTETKVWDTPNR